MRDFVRKMANSGPMLSKAGLYDMVTRKAEQLGFNVFAKNYKIDAQQLAMKVCRNPEIRIINFEEIKICGILYRGRFSTTIGLNARRSATGKNFDCMHELIHYWFHDRQTFYCIDSISDHIEWQANEGAAQFLMPYQSFIPNYCHLHDRFYTGMAPQAAHNALIMALARSYAVGETAVKFRINSLRQEIAQYIGGAAMDDIKIVSQRHEFSSENCR